MIIIQPSASRTTNLALLSPAVNCWATIIRPRCGLMTLGFLQSQAALSQFQKTALVKLRRVPFDDARAEQ